MKRFAILTALLFASSAAYAADAVVSEPLPEAPTAAVFSWSGLYLGAQAGYGWGDSQFTDRDTSDYLVYDPDGFTGGVHVGYNWQFQNNIVLGLEGDVNYSDISGEGRGRFADGTRADGVDGRSELKWNGSLRLRAGYAIDRFLPFVTGGVAFGEYDHRIVAGGTRVVDESDTHTGWTVGGGAEYAFTDNWLGRVEYRYTDFGDKTFRSDFIDEGKVDLKTHEVRIGVSYKF